MGKDIVKNEYNKFRIQVSVIILLSVFLLMIVLVLIQKTFNQDNFNSIATAIAFSASFLVTIAGIYKQNRLERITYGKLWPVFAIVLGTAYGFITSALFHIFVYPMATVFNDAPFTPILMICLVSLLCGLSAYGVTLGVFRLNQQKYLLLIALTFVIGFCAAVILTKNQDWWITSICSLGMSRYVNAGYYNFTLILTGTLLGLLAYYLRPQMRSLVAKKLLDDTTVFVMTSLYFMEMIALALIGVFPYGLLSWMNPIHMFLSSFVFFDIIAIPFFAFWFFRKFPRNFLIINYLLLLIGAAFYYLTGSATIPLPFAITEMMTIVAIIIWGALFLQTLGKLSNPKAKRAPS